MGGAISVVVGCPVRFLPHLLYGAHPYPDYRWTRGEEVRPGVLPRRPRGWAVPTPRPPRPRRPRPEEEHPAQVGEEAAHHGRRRPREEAVLEVRGPRDGDPVTRGRDVRVAARVHVDARRTHVPARTRVGRAAPHALGLGDRTTPLPLVAPTHTHPLPVSCGVGLYVSPSPVDSVGLCGTSLRPQFLPVHDSLLLLDLSVSMSASFSTTPGLNV